VLYLPSGLDFSGSAGSTIWVETNSDVTIYTGGTFDTTTFGNTTIDNMPRYAPALRIYGLTNCTLIRFGGQPTIAAFIYAPEAEVDLAASGGGGFYDFVGALYCSLIKMTGNMNFHYDEAITSQGLFPKVITQSPTNRFANPGSNVTFTVKTSIGSPVTCRWYFNQTNLVFTQSNLATTVTNASFTVTNAQITNAGNYTVVLSNALFASLTSSIASLSVGTPPVILTNPVGGS